MPRYQIIWTDEIIEHLADNDVTPEEFAEVVRNPHRVEASRLSGYPIAFGETAGGEFLACVYILINPLEILPVTGYHV